jgi:hypothetical protein
MYNLFGDPATRLRYPDAVELVAPKTAAPGAPLAVGVYVHDIPSGQVTVTLETPRSKLRAGIVGPDQLAGMDDGAAFDAMIANNQRANDLVLARTQVALAAGKAAVELELPAEPGRYAIKALVDGGGKVAAGSTWVEVR